MCNSIIYYEYALELVTENQKIKELIMTPKFASLLEETTEEQTSVYEAKIVNAIVDFINSIIDKTKLSFEMMKNKREFKPDKKLISACNEKIKNTTSEERKNFEMKKIDLHEQINNAVEEINKDIVSADKYLAKCITVNNPQDYKSLNHSKIKKDVEEFNARLVVKSNISKMKPTDISFSDLSQILRSYENFKKFADEMFDIAKSTKNTMSRVKKFTDMKLAENDYLEYLENLKDIIYLLSEYMVKSADAVCELQLASFRNKEQILTKFVEE